MIEFSKRKPQYLILYEILQQQISQGVYRQGEMLPTERELQESYSLTQPTIRQALGMLAAEGYIRKHQGKGSIVLPLPLGAGILSVEAIEAGADSLAVQTIIVHPPHLISDFPADFLFQPAIPTGTFIALERLRLVYGMPVFLEKVVLPDDNLRGLLSVDFTNQSLFAQLRRHHALLVQGGEQKALARKATPDAAALLKVPPGHPVIRIDKCINTNRLNYYFYSSLQAVTDHYLLRSTF
jgi:DNA-binding GntR family transcriptional regulator